MTLGPNVKRLMIHRMSVIAVPPGGGFAAGFEALSDTKRIASIAREATVWVEQALAAIKAVPDNPFGNDDEVIAAELLRRISDRRATEFASR